ncbi:uncharacterized protein LOC143622567 [Bidens hawaiensis]|uniref:uncharacterized protein LOC143622567 n=1 Tax=Bidens hawaiensis TaxID=980011 RepID=UPI00404B7EF2
MNELQVFKKAHCRPDGTFDSAVAEQQYVCIWREIQALTEPNREGKYEESNEPISNVAGIFEKVLGPRRGCTRGIGPKPSTTASLSDADQCEQEQTQQPFFTPAQLDRIFSDPKYLARISQHNASGSGSSNKGTTNNDDLLDQDTMDEEE